MPEVLERNSQRVAKIDESAIKKIFGEFQSNYSTSKFSELNFSQIFLFKNLKYSKDFLEANFIANLRIPPGKIPNKVKNDPIKQNLKHQIDLALRKQVAKFYNSQQHTKAKNLITKKRSIAQNLYDKLKFEENNEHFSTESILLYLEM